MLGVLFGGGILAIQLCPLELVRVIGGWPDVLGVTAITNGLQNVLLRHLGVGSSEVLELSRPPGVDGC